MRSGIKIPMDLFKSDERFHKAWADEMDKPVWVQALRQLVFGEIMSRPAPDDGLRMVPGLFWFSTGLVVGARGAGLLIQGLPFGDLYFLVALLFLAKGRQSFRGYLAWMFGFFGPGYAFGSAPLMGAQVGAKLSAGISGSGNRLSAGSLDEDGEG